MANPGDFAYTVKQQADIVRIVGEYVKLKRSGAQNYSGICPFHNEKTGSFSVHATRQFYHCFGCSASGDVFSFVQKIENVTFPEAVRLVAQKLGIAMPKMQFSSPAEAREAKQRVVLIDLHEQACKFFQEQLRRPDAATAREYLKGRGLTEEAIERFRIGFAPESGFLLRDKLKGATEDELLRESGLFSWKEVGEDRRVPSTPGGKSPAAQDEIAKSSANRDKSPAQKAALYSKFRNRVMFPICNESGKVIAFTGRTLAADEKSGPKYLNSPETSIYSKSRVLYNLHLAKEAMRALDYVILVEGQMDCISVFNAGFHNVIASSGTAFTEPQARLLARFTKKIVVNFDPDTAGAAAAERSLALLVGEDFEIRVLSLEQGFDPDLYIRRKGVGAYKDALRKSEKYFDYLIERARSLFPVRTGEGKVKAVNYLLPHVQRVPSRIVRDELSMEIAQKLQIDSAVLRQELKHVAGERKTTKVAPPPEALVTDAERVLIRALATAGDLGHDPVPQREGHDGDFEPARQAHYALTSEHLHEGLRTEALIAALLKAEEEGADPMSLPLQESERSLLAAALLDEHEELTAELLESALAALRRPKLEARQRELKALIVAAQSSNDAGELTRLVQEKMELDRAMRSASAST
ncbi:MAG TPA: CHC2 zinc finger domain-containing protein [Clostridia bacterium]|nr:CHC2 zinc finger domain-containing protein [Clostridia bacterium]